MKLKFMMYGLRLIEDKELKANSQKLITSNQKQVTRNKYVRNQEFKRFN